MEICAGGDKENKEEKEEASWGGPVPSSSGVDTTTTTTSGVEMEQEEEEEAGDESCGDITYHNISEVQPHINCDQANCTAANLPMCDMEWL